MRPHKLTMKAFGPFAEETVVDFDKMGNSVFLIAGDTGIGKTTIFDGMIYALYGKASGAGRSSLGTEALHSDFCKDGSHKEKMEVTLTFSNAGRTYTVHREMSWGKSGTSQTTTKEATLAENGAVVCYAKGREDRDSVTDKIKEILGLDADQFRRIIMLAQGEFQKFLTTGSQERGEILGKLYDNRRHKDLKLRLKAAYKVVDHKLADVNRDIAAQIETFAVPQAEGEGVRLTADTPDLLAVMERSITELERQSQELVMKMQETDEVLTALNSEKTRAERSNAQLEELTQKRAGLARLKQQDEMINTLKKKAESAKAAKELMPLERSAEQAAEEFGRLNQSIRQLTSEKGQLTEELQQRQSEALQAEETNRPQIETCQKKRNRLEGMLAAYDALEEVETLLLQKEREVTAAWAQVSDLQCQWEEKKTRLEQTLDLLMRLENAGEMAVNEAKRLLDDQQKRQRLLSELEEKTAELSKKEADLTDLEHRTSQAKWAAHHAEGEHHRLNGAFLSGQAGLLAQEMRKELQSHKEVTCPVCRTRHTAADAASFAVDCQDVPTREQVDAAFSDWNEAKNRADALEKQYSADEAVYQSTLKVLLAQAEELIGVTEQEELRQGSKLSAAKQQCGEAIAVREADYHQALTDKNEKERAAREKRTLEEETERLAAQLTVAREQWQKVSEERSAVHARAQEKRSGLTGCPKTKQMAVQQVNDLTRQAAALQQDMEAAQSSCTACRNRLENVEGRLSHAVSEKAAAEERTKEARLAFEAGLVRLGFDDKMAYQTARSPEGKLLDADRLGVWLKQTDTRISQYNIACREQEAAIRQLEDVTKDCAAVDLSALHEKIRAVRQQLECMREQDKSLGSQLHIKRMAHEKTASCLTVRRKYLAAAKKLKPLADTANGSYPFDRYVLGDFFQRILEQATVHFDRLTDGEYAIVRKTDGDGRRNTGLDLKIYNTITCIERETGSLSGGQLFEASLSLALGLSDIVQMENSGTIQIDSMFIDEGFGSLDSRTLDKAIISLQNLSADKRQIGIISHVARLEECLPKKIHVIKRSDGRGSEVRIETDQ